MIIVIDKYKITKNNLINAIITLYTQK